ncbi:hypothetical protein JD844_031959 [Phrynosoma platyrhinos]|uniref:Sciellin n=1 Tax=Phrynosoma platyrhinos TaxID=52577 RepID=A0ABQ7T417_PHRPL|nr:hypothetical protein JD844_031959 [Phrynosoma platyrhinos]
MTTLTVGKPSSNQNDVKNASLAMKSRQQVINEVNKRRTLLQDNSWIKKRPEEENTDENYGRVVLNQYKSQDSLHSLHRKTDEQDDQKALLSRYRSDTTLDRQSWMPPPVSDQKIITADMEQKRVPTASDKMSGPKMTIYSSEPNASPKSNGVVNDRPTTRNQDLDNLIKVTAKEDKNDQRRSQDQEKLIQDKANIKKHDQEHRDLDDVMQVNRAPNGYGKG